MNAADILLTGVKHHVAAISRTDGSVLWTTALPGGMGHSFVTVLCDGVRVFAHTRGELHCLDLFTGDILWSNPLKGFGYGIACLAVPGGASAPGTAELAVIAAEEERRRRESHNGHH